MESETASSAPASLAELLCALSFVADLGMGQRIEHGLRTACIGLELCREAGLAPYQQQAVFYGALLKDAGCTACAGVFAVLFAGDDLGPREDCLLLRPDHASDAVSWFWRHAPADAGLPLRMFKFLSFLAECRGVMTEGVTAHCEIGQMYSQRLGLPAAVGDAVRYSWERWDGKNMGYHLEGTAIPLQARVLHVAQTLEAAYTFGGESSVRAMASERRGTAFDPELADIASKLVTDSSFWRPFDQESVHDYAMSMRPAADFDALSANDVDAVCEVLADFADAKCRRTWHHSTEVSRVAVQIATALGLSKDDGAFLRRAGLVHDIGKAAVPVGILEKGEYLSAAETERFHTHSQHTQAVLERIQPLAYLAQVAGAHHEQLDRGGYHRGLGPEDLSLSARVLATADRYVLARSNQPTNERALADVQGLGGSTLDQRTVEALRVALDSSHNQTERTAAAAHHLSQREIEVLRLVTNGSTVKDVARTLVISPKTAEHHLENIYNKLGVTSKTAAAVYAVSNGLV